MSTARIIRCEYCKNDDQKHFDFYSENPDEYLCKKCNRINSDPERGASIARNESTKDIKDIKAILKDFHKKSKRHVIFSVISLVIGIAGLALRFAELGFMYGTLPQFLIWLIPLMAIFVGILILVIAFVLHLTKQPNSPPTSLNDGEEAGVYRDKVGALEAERNISRPSVVFRDDFKYLDDILLEYTGSSDEVNIPTGIRIIAGNCFKRKNVKRVKIPASVEIIGNEEKGAPENDGAFWRCEKLEKVIFESKSRLSEIGRYAFAGCELLSEMYGLPDNAELIIREYAFADCKSLSDETKAMLLKSPRNVNPKWNKNQRD